MFFALSILFGVTATVAAPHAKTQNDQKSRRRVEELLAQLHRQPTKKELEHATTRPLDFLALIALDKMAPPWTRSKAVSALAYFSEPKSARVYRLLLKRSNTPSSVRRRALRQLASLSRDSARPFVRKAACGKNAILRRSASQAMASEGLIAPKTLSRHALCKLSRQY